MTIIELYENCFELQHKLREKLVAEFAHQFDRQFHKYRLKLTDSDSVVYPSVEESSESTECSVKETTKEPTNSELNNDDQQLTKSESTVPDLSQSNESKLKRFDEIREETIKEYIDYLDNYLDTTLMEFLSDPDYRQKIETIANRQLTNRLGDSVLNSITKTKQDFLQQLKELSELANERRLERQAKLDLVLNKLDQANSDFTSQRAQMKRIMARLDESSDLSAVN